MKLLSLVVFLLVISTTLAATCTKSQFEKFKKEFDRTYADFAEEEYRFKIFCETVEKNEKLMAEFEGVEFGITKFADMTLREFKEGYLMNNLSNPEFDLAPEWEEPVNQANPTSFDWRNHNPSVVTPVYNQGQCGACWAFSATENIESVWALHGHTLTELSMQQVNDCDKQSSGCDGGWPYTVYPYVINTRGIDSYASYPYVGRDTACTFSKSSVAADISSWVYVTKTKSEQAMQTYVATTAPISVCVDASAWSSYKSGIFPAKACGKAIDHCVIATGYNTQDGYWWIRNSWGTSWGIQGYMQLEYGVDACAVAQVVTSSTI
jgi:hypothetical protein